MSEPLSKEAQELITEAKASMDSPPPPGEQAQVWQHVAHQAPSVPAVGDGGAPTGAGIVTTAVKAAAVGSVVVAVIVGIDMMGSSKTPPPASESVQSVESVESVVPAEREVPAEPPATDDPVSVTPEVHSVDEPEESRNTEPQPKPRPPVSRSKRRRARERARPAQKPPEPSPKSSSLAAEMRLLRAAQAALREGRPQRALDLAKRHATQFPDGMLESERMAAHAMASCELGRRDQGRAMARRFARRWPNSPLVTSVQEACAP